MPTTLNKTVRRVTRGHYPAVFSRPHKIVVSLEPGDIIRFRVFRGKTAWDLSIDGAMRHAVALAVLIRRQEKMAAKKRRAGK